MAGINNFKNVEQNRFAAANGGRGTGIAPDLPRGATQADVDRARQSQIQPATTTNAANAPANAPAAPTGNQNYVFTGLAEFMNTYQNDLVKTGKREIADFYHIEFLPEDLGGSTLKKPLSTDRSKTALKDVSTAKEALDRDTDRVDNNSQNVSIQQGTQIVQAIDQILRSSNFVSDQALFDIDPVTQVQRPNPGAGGANTVWYKITVEATSLGYDGIIGDYAYNMNYLVTPYSVASVQSEFFPKSRYRGSHKSFQYWFTGQNTQILNFEQNFDYLYKLIITGAGAKSAAKLTTTDYREQYSRTNMPTTTQKTGQQTFDTTNQAADSFTDFFYSPTDAVNVKLRIIGDPAWIQQGEVAGGSSNGQFTFAPFNPDGTINYDSQAVIFDISWNQPQDYDFSVGIMNVNNQQGRARQNYTYTAVTCKSFFSKGRFEQELEGKLLIEPLAVPPAPRAEEPAPVAPSVAVRTAPILDTTVPNYSSIDPGLTGAAFGRFPNAGRRRPTANRTSDQRGGSDANTQ
jgi:hypothetical protein